MKKTPAYFKNTKDKYKYGVIAAFSEDEFIGYIIVMGTVESIIYCYFLKQLCNYLEKKDKNYKNKYIFYMDNARYHTSN